MVCHYYWKGKETGWRNVRRSSFRSAAGVKLSYKQFLHYFLDNLQTGKAATVYGLPILLEITGEAGHLKARSGELS